MKSVRKISVLTVAIILLSALFGMVKSPTNVGADENISLTVPAVAIVDIGEEWFAEGMRTWQGASPGIARTKGGRLFACLFSGGVDEPKEENYAIYMYSDDDGKTWVDPFLIVHHPDPQTRVFDPSLQVDSLGRLWINWNQQYPMPGGRDFPYGWWRIRIDNPDAPIEQVKEAIRTQTPKCMSRGIRINKFIEMSNGEWLQPMAESGGPFIRIMVSGDQGETWTLRGSVQKQMAGVYEPMVVEKLDGTLWLLTRLGMAQSTLPPGGGVGASYSDDGGESWSDIEESLPYPYVGSSSRLFFGRLKSGALLFITNNTGTIWRRNLTAFISYDDGKTWSYSLLLDDRDGVRGSIIDGPSYPDCVQAEDGRIYVVWDFGRYNEMELRMSVFTEEDIKAGKLVSGASRDKVIVSKIGPYKDIVEVKAEIPESIRVKKKTQLKDIIKKLPTDITIVDEDGKEVNLQGNWAGKNYNPLVEDYYEFYFALANTEEMNLLKDTHKLLSVEVVVGSPKKPAGTGGNDTLEPSEGGCNGSVNAYGICALGVVLSALLIKGKKIRNGRKEY